jgi:putative hydrolase of the HAD superfamily
MTVIPQQSTLVRSSRSKTEVIFFDAVGTLFTVQGNVGQLYARVAQEYGVSVDPQRLNRAFYQAFQNSPAAAFPGVDPAHLIQLERAWWQDVVERTFLALGYGISPLASHTFPQFPDYFQQVYDLFATAAAWQIYPETISVLQTLACQGMQLGVISNFDSRLYPVLQALQLDQFFVSITISTAVGAAKPDPQVFQTALAQQQVLPSAALHVGDSFSHDYLGAKQAGLQALWLNRSDSELEPHPALSTAEPADQIGDLRAIVGRLS